MRETILYKAVVIFSVLLFFQCANRGTANGGEKDVTPPMIVKPNIAHYKEENGLVTSNDVCTINFAYSPFFIMVIFFEAQMYE